MQPRDLLEKHFRLVPVQKAALKRLGLLTIEDLLHHVPARYEHAGSSGSVAGLISGQHVTLYGTLSKLEAKKLWKSRRPATEGWFEDGTGRIRVMWFNQPYIAKMAPQGVVIRLTGTVAGNEKPYITNPEIAPVSAADIPAPLFNEHDGTEVSALYPVYPESRGITSLWFYHQMKKILAAGVHEQLSDPIPADICDRLHLPRLAPALVYLHMPENERDAEAARKRFAFEEIFMIQLAKKRERKENDQLRSPAIAIDPAAVERFTRTLPYRLTGAQERAISEIFADFSAGHPMARLLEGDVGSGKTAVAAVTSYAVVTSRPSGRASGTLQVAYMAPTEILATQHFQSFIEYFKELPINIGLITGSGCYKFPSKSHRDEATKISRAQLLKWVENGEIAMLIGTHAIIQKSVRFKDLAYAIVDEQHRFGTKQRMQLAQKSREGAGVPHFLSMTATPIPRTLALTIYGDLDLSVLDELPPQRAEVITKLLPKDKRDLMYAVMRQELAAGRQAYVVCPRIDEPDPEKEMALQAKSAKAEAERLQKDIFPDYSVGLVHGKLKPAEKDAAMEAFIANETQILVATSVIEVGVNVPNATVIAIEGAERFGLSQLHQLRGRIRRSEHTAHCFLLPDTNSQISLTRLRALAKSSNGFELAEHDLALRGAGDLYGRAQWGVSDIGMEALKNPRLIEAARTEAERLIDMDPSLAKHAALRDRVDAVARELHQE